MATPEADPEGIIMRGKDFSRKFLLLSQIENLPGKNHIAEIQF
jgi:hypothetical protein